MLRSRKLAAAATPTGGGALTVYTCPAGSRAIVRDIRLSESGSTDIGRAYVAVFSSGGSIAVALFDGRIPATTNVYVVCDTVLEAGDFIQFYSAGQSASVWISGAVLNV